MLPGDKVGGRYRILRPLAQGGMASVFLALDEPRGAEVVLKQLGPTRPELLPAFRSEFSLLASLTHPHLAQVLDFGSTHVRGQVLHYYTAEWVDGATLEDHARDAGDERWLRALSDALLGLGALHDIGVVHGDFNPRNILVRHDGRGVLIDLGCARPVGDDAGSVSGTPGFIAPELMGGGPSAIPADLYAVGRTLARLYDLSGSTPAPPTRQLILSASSPDPRQRPPDARSMLSTLGMKSPSGVLRAQSLRLVGREAERAQFATWLAGLVGGQPGPRVLAISGARGSGKSRLLRELLSLAELQVNVVRALSGESASVQWLLQSATQTSERYAGGRGALAAARALGRRGEPILLALEDTERLSSVEAELLTQLARCLDETTPVGLVLTSAGPPLFADGERMPLSALDLESLRTWTQGTLSDATLGHILALTEGNPARIELALRRWTGPAPSDGRLAASPESEAGAVLGAALIEKTLAGASPGERERLGLLAALDGQVDGHDWGLSVHDFAFGFETGLLERDRTLARLSSLVELSSLRGALSPELQKSAHRKIAAALSATTGNAFNLAEREAEIIRHLALAGARHEASERLESASPIWRVEARPFLRRVAELETTALNLTCQLCFAEMALLVGEARRASSLVAAVLRARPEPSVEVEARLLGAAALTRLGRGARAERLLSRVALHEVPPRTRAWVAEHVARARIARGDHAGAKRAAEEGLALGAADVTPKLREALGIAALYGGEVPQAEAYFSEVLSLVGAQTSPRDRCRLLGYRAIAAFRAGHAARARDDHAEALEVAESHGLDDLICVCSLNLGTALQQLGDLGGAFERYERGLAISRAVGRESTELVLLFNRLNIQVEITDLARAEVELAHLERRAKQSQLVHFGPALALVRAEIALKTGALAQAREALESAASGYEELGLDRERVEVELCRAEVEIAEGRLDTAVARLADAKRRAGELDAVDLGLRSDLLQGRIDAARRDVAAVTRLAAALDVAERSSQQLIAAKLATELWLAAEALGLLESARHAEHAHRLWDRLAVHLTEAQREAFWSAPPRSQLLRTRRAEGKTPADERAGPDAQALLRLLSLSRRINSSLSMEHVLKYAVDAAVELSAAERGFLLLRDDAHAPVTLRAGTEPDAVPSQTVIDRVMSLGEPLITTDAEADARLMGQRSVHAQRLKAILCVPIGTPSELMGALYVDSRVHRAQLTARARDLLMALADQVAVALSNVRLHASLEQRSLELAAEKQTVERLAQGQDRELRRLREQIESQRRTLEFRYDYAQIVGRGPGMRAVLTELDRIVDADVNVLIQGESGTGKELIARAIHVHGPRKAGPFVAINCAALPESLLESELFGYVRGAFTGADRDKTGLMLAARGGTLFLDELAELPLSTQAKLLRVLQEREVRPLGSERALPLDVRLVCATHRELLAAVAAGEFRQDLFYRVAVVTVRLPPLRERVEDLPELARAILGRLAKSADRPAPELGRDALRALRAHPFPGNIRELENILTRAFVISGGARIGARDLELSRSIAPATRTTNRKAFAMEERQRILEALNATRWNVSVVSRTLGIPRNTLYRKLQRYGLTRD